MPLDPIRAINEQRAAFRAQEQGFRAQAAKQLSEDFPDFVATASDEQLDQAQARAVESLREFTENTVTDPSAPLSAADNFVPSRAARSGLSSALDRLPGQRPESTFGALGLGALESGASQLNVPGFQAAPERPLRLDEAGRAGQMVAEGVAGAIPMVRGARLGSTIGKTLLKSAGASGIAAGITGAANQVLENAQALIDGSDGLSRRTAFNQALAGTPADSILARGLGEAALEASMATGFAFGPTLAKNAFARASGLAEPAVDRMIALASRHNINLAVQDVTSLRALERARDTLGRNPLFNRAYKARSRIQSEEVKDAVNDSLFAIAPSIREISEATADTKSAKILSANMRAFNRIEGAFTTFKGRADSLYSAFREAARREGAQVGNSNTMFRAAAVRHRIRNLPAEGVVGLDGAVTYKTPLPKKVSGIIDKEMTRLINMEPRPDLEAFIRRGAEIEDLINSPQLKDSKEARKILIGIKRAMEDDMHTNLVGSQEVLNLLDAADEFYKDGIQLLSGQGAKRFKRIDRSFADVQLKPIGVDDTIPNPGSVSPNKVATTMLSSDDHAVVKNIHEIMLRGDPIKGQQDYKEMVGVYMESLIEGARDKQVRGADFAVTDTRALRSALGLDNKSSDKFIANEEMMKLAGVNLHQFGEILDLADQFFKDGVPDISSFVARRAVIGGLGSALRSFNPMQLAGKGAKGESAWNTAQNMGSAAGAFLLLKGAGKALTNPNTLKSYRVLLDPKRNAKVRIQAFRRLMLMDSGFLVLDEATGNSISKLQNKVSLAPNELARISGDFNRNRGNSGFIQGAAKTFQDETRSVETPLPNLDR